VKTELLETLRCPACGAVFDHSGASGNADEIDNGFLSCQGPERHRYPVIDSIPRFVSSDNYAANFGFQWTKFRLTQLDSHSGTHITRDRFFTSTGWRAEELKGKQVLDVGCGAGRFAEIALSSGAKVVALDYSIAVEACWKNNRAKGDLACVQGDIYHLPFAPGSFDYVYCLGVLQHTPDVARAFSALASQPKTGGRLAVDIYPKLWQNIASGKDWVRPLTKRMNPMKLFSLVENVLVPVLLPISRIIGRTPFLGRKLRRIIPVSNYEGVFPLNPVQLREWAVLDTYDMLAPAYDQPQTADTLRSWFQVLDFKEVEIFRAGHLIGRGLR
jgi:SAM-dependent methyltransferase